MPWPWKPRKENGEARERQGSEGKSPRIHARMEATAPQAPRIPGQLSRLRRSIISHQPARIRFLGGRARNTAERSRATGKKARGGGVRGDGNLRLAPGGGAGGHSVGGRSLLSSDVGVVGSSSRSPGDPADDEAAAGEGRASASSARGGGAVVLIGVSAGRTSPAAEVILRRMRCVGCEGGEERR
jgi:hypothetical protein